MVEALVDALVPAVVGELVHLDRTASAVIVVARATAPIPSFKALMHDPLLASPLLAASFSTVEAAEEAAERMPML